VWEKIQAEVKEFFGFFPHPQWFVCPTHTEAGIQGLRELMSPLLLY
jgi:hypothetical protein